MSARTDLAELLRGEEERLSHCVHCGFCLPACPTYTRLGDEADSPRGRLHLMRAVAEGRLEPGSEAFRTHLDRCLGCRGCETVCPSGVEYGHLLERARQVSREAAPAGGLSRGLLTAIRTPLLFHPWMLGSRLLRRTGIPALLARILPGRRGTIRTGMAMLAASAPAGLRRRGRAGGEAIAHRGDGTPAPPSSRKRVGRAVLLRGCVQDHLFRRVNDATRRVLEANGWEVVEGGGAGCCGALHAHAGALPEAREMARRTVERVVELLREAGRPTWIVANAAGCGATLREYGELLEGEDDATLFASRVRDISELLAGEGRTPVAGGALPIRVAYDPPCHLLHGQRVAAPPLHLLRSIPGVEVVEVPRGEECCGGAGIYGITHPELGGRIGEDKVAAVLSTGAEVVATGNPGCAMQIGGGLRMVGSGIQVAHPVELLDESYRRGGVYDALGRGS